MISTQNIAYSYDGVRHFRFPDVHCDSGQNLAILGPSGSGKTTLLHMMAGLLAPKTGEVYIDKKSIFGMSSGERRVFRGHHIGLVFQVPHFMSALTMAENMSLTQRLGRRKQNPQEVKDYFNELGIGHRIHARPSEMSQGEIQRASLIRAIINEPDVILADEPTSALDDQSAQRVIALLQQFSQQNGSALIIVTHDQRVKNEVENCIELPSLMPQ